MTAVPCSGKAPRRRRAGSPTATTGASRFLSTAPRRRRPREMKESILDVLLYLFEHYFTEDAAPPPGDRWL
ncbi:MAG: hypothetical protein ABIO58_04265, partial [Luteimonas sp.]